MLFRNTVKCYKDVVKATGICYYYAGRTSVYIFERGTGNEFCRGY